MNRTRGGREPHSKHHGTGTRRSLARLLCLAALDLAPHRRHQRLDIARLERHEPERRKGNHRPRARARVRERERGTRRDGSERARARARESCCVRFVCDVSTPHCFQLSLSSSVSLPALVSSVLWSGGGVTAGIMRRRETAAAALSRGAIGGSGGGGGGFRLAYRATMRLELVAVQNHVI